MPFNLSNLSEKDRETFDHESCSFVRDGVRVWMTDELLSEPPEIIEGYANNVVSLEKSHVRSEHA